MNKTAVITGASKGIGKALAEKMLGKNYTVIGTSRSGKIQIKHPNFHSLALDLTDFSSIEKAQIEINNNFEHINVLINNAALGSDLHFDLPERQSFEQTFDTNVKGTVFFTEAMVNRIPNDGIILNISSKMGSVEVCEKFGSVAYRMSKSALNMYTKILKNRLAGKVKVACIHPGWVKTTIIESNLKNATLTPEESAEKIFSFLMSDFKNGIYWDCEEGVALPW